MNLDDERLAHVGLSAVSEPGDTVTGALLQLVGAPETLRMICTRDPLPDTIDPTEGELWRARLSPRLRDADVERIVVDTERRGLTLLTPDDPPLARGAAPTGCRVPACALDRRRRTGDRPGSVASRRDYRRTCCHQLRRARRERTGQRTRRGWDEHHLRRCVRHRRRGSSRSHRVTARQHGRDPRWRTGPAIPGGQCSPVRANCQRRRRARQRAPTRLDANSLALHATQPAPRHPRRRDYHRRGRRPLRLARHRRSRSRTRSTGRCRARPDHQRSEHGMPPAPARTDRNRGDQCRGGPRAQFSRVDVAARVRSLTVVGAPSTCGPLGDMSQPSIGDEDPYAGSAR